MHNKKQPNFQTPDQVFEELFVDLHMNAVHPDGKVISDAIPNTEPAAILALYRKQKDAPDFDIKAFLGVYLEKGALYGSVLQQLEKIPEIVNVDYTTGNYSMFVKILCRDTNHLREILHDKIQKVNGIERTETIISLNEDLNRSIEFIEK